MSTCEIETNSLINEDPATRMARKCIQCDIVKVKNNIENSSIIFVDPIDADFLHLEAAILGPMSTPYENGVFLLDIKLSEQYPFFPPLSVTFKRATMHPNISECGKFMSELLKSENWSPAMTIQDILEHVWASLAVPNVDSNECDPIRTHSYKTDKEQFEIMARDYSVKYARAT